MQSYEENPLYQILNPRSICIMGASNQMDRMGSLALLNIRGSGYEGPIYPIHVKERVIQGITAYPDTESLPETPELIILAVPAPKVPEALNQAGRKGIHRAVILTAGYSEIGENGRALQKNIDAVVGRYGIKYIGPNCIGFVNSRRRINTSPMPFDGRSGGIGLASHSGSYVGQTLPYAEDMGMGIAEWISLGNEGSLDMTDTLNYFQGHPDIKVVGLYVEGIRRPNLFKQAALRLAREKPIIALYAGNTPEGARAAASHTAVMASSGNIMRSFFSQCGIIEAETILDLFDWLNALERQPLPKGPRVAILANSGGPATSMADHVGKSELSLPPFSPQLTKKLSEIIPVTGSARNPIDFTFSPDIAGYAAKIPSILADSDEIDAILVYGVFGGSLLKRCFQRANFEMLSDEEQKLMGAFDSQADTMARAFKDRLKPVIGASFNIRGDSGVRRMVVNWKIPFFSGPERAVKAMEALWQYKKVQERISQ
jgi:acyl-CoA synthetase (NDP forming)